MADDQLRDDVLADLAADVTAAWREWLAEHDPTDRERTVGRAWVVQALGGHVEPPRRSALELNLTDLSGLCIVGGAAHALIELWPSWPSSPRRTVADHLKVADPDTMIRVRGLLADIDGRL